MNKLILIVAITLVHITSIYSQNIEKGIKGGLNLSSLSIDGNNDKNIKSGLNAGLWAKFPLAESFSVQPEILYSNQGIKTTYNQAGIEGETKFNLNYLNIPIKLVFNLSDDFEFQFGPYVGYLLNANTNTNTQVLDYFKVYSEDEINKDRFQTLDFGLTAGLGFTLEPIILGFNYNLGLTQVAQKDDITYDMLGDAKNTVIQVYVGLKF